MATTNTVDWIVKQSKRYPLLTTEQEIVYGRQIQAWLKLRDLPDPTRQEQAQIRRGLHAYQAMFRANIRLAVAVAQRFYSVKTSFDAEDLIQEGLIGLQQAILRFDSTRGYKFSTYSFPFIRGCISRAIENRGRMIRIPVHASERVRKVMRYMDEQVANGQQPTLAKAADHFGYELTSLRRYFNHYGRPLSLDAPDTSRDNSNPLTLLDAVAEQPIEPDWAAETLDNMHELHEALNQLTPIQRNIVEHLYGSGAETVTNFSVVARKIGRSREGVRKQHQRALDRLRQHLNVSVSVELDSAIQSAA